MDVFPKDNPFKEVQTSFQLLFIALVFCSKNLILNIKPILRTWEIVFIFLFYFCKMSILTKSFPLSSLHLENLSELVKRGPVSLL